MVKIYKSEFTLLQQEILQYLMIKAGVVFNARGLAMLLNRTQAGVVKALPELEKQGLVKITKDKDSGRWSIEFNKDNQKAIELKRVENLQMIYESGLARFLQNSFPGATIILFGSYSRGEDVQTSDVDIAVIGLKGKKNNELNLTIFERLLQKKIIINFYHSFKEIHKHLKENILNGIILSGGVEL
ncbi:nucleotidyltransferase domain-containing protein [Candidatus Pacearchaeota archaeon]|nr:nucleotidyltransferase domain-containing protein [Candidatus Pacearchaeota archaeon]